MIEHIEKIRCDQQWPILFIVKTTEHVPGIRQKDNDMTASSISWTR